MESPEQIRAARALLNWSADRLAAAAKVSIRSVQRWEAGAGASLLPVIRAAIVTALEDAGVEFTPGGVRLKPKPGRAAPPRP